MSTVDQKEKRAMLEAAASPLSVVPAVLGGTGGAILFALGTVPVIGIAVAAGSVVVGAAIAIYRGFNSKVIEKKVLEEIANEERNRKIEEEKRLRDYLAKDEKALLDDIIGLKRVLESMTASDVVKGEVLSSIKELLDQTYITLFRIPQISKITDVTVNSKSATKVLTTQRKKIYDDAKKNVEYAANVVAEYQTIGERDNSEEVRKQLSVRLNAAKTFDGQLASLQLSGVSPELIAQYSKM